MQMDEMTTLVTIGWIAFALLYLVERIFQSKLPRVYFEMGLPFRPEPLPLNRAPEGHGETDRFGWRVENGGKQARFWARPRRGALQGFHGSVFFHADSRGQVHLRFFWFPPWAPVVALLWLVMLAQRRGELLSVGLLAVGLMVLVFLLYQRAVESAVRELRFGLSEAKPEEDEAH